MYCVFYANNGDGYCRKSDCTTNTDCIDGLTDTCLLHGDGSSGECVCGPGRVNCVPPYISSCYDGTCYCGEKPSRNCKVGTYCNIKNSKCVPGYL